MKVLTVFIIVCFGGKITSSPLYGTEVTATTEWWNDNFFLKLNSPSGKTFYIDFVDMTIHREKDRESFVVTGLIPPPGQPELLVPETEVPIDADERLPFISFVSKNYKIYDIYFEYDGINSYSPTLEESEFVYENKNWLIRPRLDSFVGPNNKLYEIIYTDGNELHIAEKSPEALDHFQIKTFGPYDKWEHTYDFSENGEVVVDHTISPIPVLANRSISLPEVEPDHFTDENVFIRTFVKFNSQSGTKYHITSQLDIAPITYDDVEETAYISFTEPNGQTYEIQIDEKDGRASLVAKSVVENYFGSERLYSFVAPNGKVYTIDHKNGSDNEVPVLVSNSSDSSDLQITLLQPTRYYNKYVKFIFSDNGKNLFDRVDEIDWTPLNELPAVPVDEVTADYVITNLPYLTLYTPSGNNYHIFTTGANASITVEKGGNHSQGLYITYLETGGRKAHIHYVAGVYPYLEEEEEEEEEATPNVNEDKFSFHLVSFGTPDKKEYSITATRGDDNEWKPSIQQQLQVKEPIDLPPVNGLTITIQNGNGWQYVYRFTWNGDKLVEASFEPPKQFVGNKVLQSLIGK